MWDVALQKDKRFQKSIRHSCSSSAESSLLEDSRKTDRAFFILAALSVMTDRILFWIPNCATVLSKASAMRLPVCEPSNALKSSKYDWFSLSESVDSYCQKGMSSPVSPNITCQADIRSIIKYFLQLFSDNWKLLRQNSLGNCLPTWHRDVWINIGHKGTKVNVIDYMSSTMVTGKPHSQSSWLPESLWLCAGCMIANNTGEYSLMQYFVL